MRITIAERLRPFSHEPGTCLILPGPGYQVEIFPCLVRIYHLKEKFPVLLLELSFGFKGPIQQFTICNDLEKGCISVWGETQEGWMRYHLIGKKEGDGIRLFVERAPTNGFSIQKGEECYLLHRQQGIDFLNEGLSFEPYHLPLCDRLSLGCHKAQDWVLVKRRLDLREMIPFLHRLGQLVPVVENTELSAKLGTLSLLEECQRALWEIEKKPKEAEQKWLNLILGGFHGIFVPQLEDRDYQGLVSESLAALDESPLILLSKSSDLIRQLFFQQQEEQVVILPYLLPSFSSGRLLDVSLKEGRGKLSFEWSKKTIRRLILYAEKDQQLTFKFRSHVRSYRLRQGKKDSGQRKESFSSLILKKNEYYFLDNFQ